MGSKRVTFAGGFLHFCAYTASIQGSTFLYCHFTGGFMYSGHYLTPYTRFRLTILQFFDSTIGVSSHNFID